MKRADVEHEVRACVEELPCRGPQRPYRPVRRGCSQHQPDSEGGESKKVRQAETRLPSSFSFELWDELIAKETRHTPPRPAIEDEHRVERCRYSEPDSELPSPCEKLPCGFPQRGEGTYDDGCPQENEADITCRLPEPHVGGPVRTAQPEQQKDGGAKDRCADVSTDATRPAPRWNESGRIGALRRCHRGSLSQRDRYEGWFSVRIRRPRGTLMSV